MKTSMVDFLPGDGKTYVVEVAYIHQNAVDVNSLCAFCHGDPCAEEYPENPLSSMIGYYRDSCKDQGYTFETCPMCSGRPS